VYEVVYKHNQKSMQAKIDGILCIGDAKIVPKNAGSLVLTLVQNRPKLVPNITLIKPIIYERQAQFV